MGVEEFLSAIGGGGPPEGPPEARPPAWEDLLRPSLAALILGRRGSGKSALAYFLAERLARAHGLLPAVVNFPRERASLLPRDWVVVPLREVYTLEDAVVLVDEGTWQVPAGAKIEEVVRGFVSLARQRNQVIIFVFHAAADVGSRILRGADLLVFKEPSHRQILFGSKDRWMRRLLEEAKERFRVLRESGADVREWAYVDSEQPEYRGLLRNPLPTFWSEDLSRPWAGVDTLPAGPPRQPPLLELPLPPPGRPRLGWLPPRLDLVYPVTEEMRRRRRKVEEHHFQRHGWDIFEAPRRASAGSSRCTDPRDLPGSPFHSNTIYVVPLVAPGSARRGHCRSGPISP